MKIIRSLSVPAFVLVACGAVAACSTQTQAPPVASESQSRIIGGKVDTTHPSVVALIQQGAKNSAAACTATIIKTDVTKQVGYVLTAAHCVEGIDGGTPAPSKFVVIEGGDYNVASALTYAVTAYQKHPSYGGNAGDAYDFAMVKIAGVDASTKVTPFATKTIDKLKVGAKVDLIGYGKTSDNDTDNTIRHIINKPIATEEPLLFGFNQTDGGLCQGDSGGPVIANIGGVDYVVGVNSFVSSSNGTCLQGGFSGRISAAQAWVEGYIAGTGGTDVQTCDECAAAVTSGKGSCVDEQQACSASDKCIQYNDCVNLCKAGDSACQTKCASGNAAGKTVFDGYIGCIESACKVQCTSACGFAFDGSEDGGKANACFEGKCCSQGSSCNDDATCEKCFSATPPSSATCQGNAAYTALVSCISEKCADEFGIKPAKCGFTFDDSEDAGAANKCFEGSCCAQGTACDGDETCTSCLTDKDADAATCQENKAYADLGACLTESCAEEFGIDQGGAGGTSSGKGGASSGKGGTSSGKGGTSSGTAGANDGGDGEGAGTGGTTGKGKGGSAAVNTGNPNQTGSGSNDSGGCSVGGPASGSAGAFGGLALAAFAMMIRGRRGRR